MVTHVMMWLIPNGRVAMELKTTNVLRLPKMLAMLLVVLGGKTMRSLVHHQKIFVGYLVLVAIQMDYQHVVMVMVIVNILLLMNAGTWEVGGGNITVKHVNKLIATLVHVVWEMVVVRTQYHLNVLLWEENFKVEV